MLGVIDFIAPKAVRKWLGNGMFLGVVAFISFLLACAVYGLFYNIYIPRISYEYPVHLHYDYEEKPNAYYVVDFSSFKQFLTTSQAYDVSVVMLVPESAHNLELGNFMLETKLISLRKPRRNETVNINSESELYHHAKEYGQVLYQVAKPGMLFYRSFWTRTTRTWLKMLLFLTNLSQEAQILKISLLNDVYDQPQTPITHAIVRLSASSSKPNNILQVYAASIRLDAHFSGLRYLMYYWFIPTALSLTLSIAWFFFAMFMLFWLSYSAVTVEEPVELVLDQDEPLKIVPEDISEPSLPGTRSPSPFLVDELDESDSSIDRYIHNYEAFTTQNPNLQVEGSHDRERSFTVSEPVIESAEVVTEKKARSRSADNFRRRVLQRLSPEDSAIDLFQQRTVADRIAEWESRNVSPTGQSQNSSESEQASSERVSTSFSRDSK